MAENKSPKKEGNRFDKILHENADSALLPIVAEILGIEIKSVEFRKTKMQTTIEKEADGCYWLETADGREVILHLEYQSSNDPKMILRVNLYVALIRYLNPGVPIESVVVYVGDEPMVMRTELTEEEIFRGFILINAKTLDFKKLLQSEEPSQIVTAVLADYPKEQGKEVLYKIIARLREVCQADNDLIKYCNQLLVLSFLRKLDVETKIILENMAVHIDITGSKVFQEAFMPKMLEYERLIKEEKVAKEQERRAKEQARRKEEQTRRKEEEARRKEVQERKEKEIIQRMTVTNFLQFSSLDVSQIAAITKTTVDFVLNIQLELKEKRG